MPKHVYVIVAVVVALAVTFVSAQQRESARQPSISEMRVFDLPSTRIMTIGPRVVRLDTRDGSMYLLRGDPGLTGTNAHWLLRVPAVKAEHSGLLDIRKLDGNHGTYLVDLRRGTTWILRWRGNENGAWSLLKEHR